MTPSKGWTIFLASVLLGAVAANVAPRPRPRPFGGLSTERLESAFDADIREGRSFDGIDQET